MLELMRKKAGSWIIKILLGLIALAFALSFGVYSYYGQRQEVALKVNDEPITMTQFREEMNQLGEEARRRLGPQYDALAPLLNLKQRALERLVNRVLLFQAAYRMGITVGPMELQNKIKSMPAFQRNGAFDLNYYNRALARARLTPEKFEEGLRGELILQKLSTLVAGSAQVTPLEVERALDTRFSELRAVYKAFDPEGFLAKQKADDKEIEEFYNNNKNRYLEPEKVALRYIVFPVAGYRDKVEVLDEDITEAYDSNISRYSVPEQVHARHILIKLPEKPRPGEEKEAKEKAEKIMDQAKKPGADFAALAKKHSQGPTSKQGGDLGYFKRGQMVPEFEKLAFDQLKKGEVGLVKTDFGYHVVKVEDHKEPSVTPLKEVKGLIKKELAEKAAAERAQAQAENVFDQVAGGIDIDKLAGDLKRSVNKTPPVAIGAEVEGLPGLKGLKEGVEGLEAGSPTPVMTYQDGAVLAVLDKRIPEAVKPLKEVEEQVRVAVRQKKAAEAAEKAAAGLLAEISGKPDAAAALAQAQGAEETDWLLPNASIKGLSGSGGLVSALFMRPKQKPALAKPVNVGSKFVAAAVKERKPPTDYTKEEKRKQVTDSLLAQKRRELLQGFVDDLRAKADIKTLVNL